jgi:hypothetical protein
LTRDGVLAAGRRRAFGLNVFAIEMDLSGFARRPVDAARAAFLGLDAWTRYNDPERLPAVCSILRSEYWAAGQRRGTGWSIDFKKRNRSTLNRVEKIRYQHGGAHDISFIERK